MGTTEIAPGWYPDAAVFGSIRYWDGTRWTAHTAVPLASTVPSPVSTALPYSSPRFAAQVPPAPQLTPAPRKPRKRPPFPALLVAGTLLIAFPLAIAIGILSARASAPAPLDIPVLAEARTAADAAAQRDAKAIGAGIRHYYLVVEDSTWPPPTVVMRDGAYSLEPTYHGTRAWTWPPIDSSYGVTLGGELGYSPDTWCVWLEAPRGTVKTWQVMEDGVTEGNCSRA